MMNILFVCTGNTCRSPMAEAVFNNMCATQNLNHRSFSKGMNVIVPQRVSQKSINALKQKNIEISKCFSEQLVYEDIKSADLVLTMTSGHKMALKSIFPEFKTKIFTLNEKALGKDSDIADPFGGGQDIYDMCFNEISEAVKELLCLL